MTDKILDSMSPLLVAVYAECGRPLSPGEAFEGAVVFECFALNAPNEHALRKPPLDPYSLRLKASTGFTQAALRAGTIAARSPHTTMFADTSPIDQGSICTLHRMGKAKARTLPRRWILSIRCATPAWHLLSARNHADSGKMLRNAAQAYGIDTDAWQSRSSRTLPRKRRREAAKPEPKPV